MRVNKSSSKSLRNCRRKLAMLKVDESTEESMRVQKRLRDPRARLTQLKTLKYWL